MTPLNVRQAIEMFEEKELQKLQTDLENGGHHLRQIVNFKLKEKKLEKKGICAGCGKDLGETDYSYTLVFGPNDFQKKASFCEIDCLNYFIEKLQNLKQKRGENHGCTTADQNI